MKYNNKQIFLFIEPSLSAHFAILRAQEKGHTALVISRRKGLNLLPEATFRASSSFFQVDTNNEETVLELIDKIAQKFYINGVIPGSEYSLLLTSKVTTYLNKLGLTLESALTLHSRDLLHHTLRKYGISTPSCRKVSTKKELKDALEYIQFPCVFKLRSKTNLVSLNMKKIHTPSEALSAFEALPGLGGQAIVIEEYIQGEDYSVEGFLVNAVPHVISSIEILYLFEKTHTKKGYIVCSRIDLDRLKSIKACLKDIPLALNLKTGPFHAKIRFSEKGPFLVKFRMCLAKGFIPHLIRHATGIDYYDTIFRLFSGQPVSLYKTQHLNAGIVFFYNPLLKKAYSNAHLESLLENPYIREIKTYDRMNREISPLSNEAQIIGHAIFLHEEYQVLKKHMSEVELTSLDI